MLTTGLAQLAAHFGDSEPFGPETADELSPELRAALYDEDGGLHRTADLRRVAYIVGRKGSGKTSFLHRPISTHTSISSEFRSEEAFNGVQQFVRLVRSTGSVVFAADVADAWEFCFWQATFGAMLDRGHLHQAATHELQVIWDYLRWARLSSPLTADERFNQGARILQEHVPPELRMHTIRDVLDSLGPRAASFGRARGVAAEVLQRFNAFSYLLVDSLEDLHKRVGELDIVIDGLLTLVGRLNRGPVQLLRPRVCLPAELLDLLPVVSSNPAKSFVHDLSLQWTAPELLHIAGKRLLLSRKSRAMNLGGQLSAAQDVVAGLLPLSISNRMGGDEVTIAYLLRHTQLLPRHILMLLNAIGKSALGSGESIAAGGKVSVKSVRNGIAAGEKRIIADIESAFSGMFPWLRPASKRVFRELPWVFDKSSLHRQYNEGGVRSISGLEFEDYVDALLRVGAIGVKVGETARYEVGEFIYTAGDELSLSYADTICVHPLFAQRYGSKLALESGKPAKPVYPYGSDPVHQYRRAFEEPVGGPGNGGGWS